MSSAPTYEIYTFAKGRWIVDARFKSAQKQSAIEDAKRIAVQPGIDQVKVIRETFDDEDGLIKESTVFKTTLKGASTNGSGVSAASDRPVADFSSPAKPRRKVRAAGCRSTTKSDQRGGRRRKKSSRRSLNISPGVRLMYKLFLIAIASLAFAITITVFYGRYLSQLRRFHPPVFGIGGRGAPCRGCRWWIGQLAASTRAARAQRANVDRDRRRRNHIEDLKPAMPLGCRER